MAQGGEAGAAAVRHGVPDARACWPAAAGNGADARVLSNSAQYRRLLKMYGSKSSGGQEAPLVVDEVQSAAWQAQQGAQQAQQGSGNDGAANDGCQMCQYVVQYVNIAIASKETIAQVG